MPSSENAEVDDLIARAFIEEFGGRASSGEVFRAVGDDLPEHLLRHLASGGLKAAIGRYFRQKNSDGLSIAPEADPDGTHVQLDLLSVPEYQYVVGRHLNLSTSHHSQAQKYADKCEVVHGVIIPLRLAGESA